MSRSSHSPAHSGTRVRHRSSNRRSVWVGGVVCFAHARLPVRRPVSAHRRPATGDRQARRWARARRPPPDAPRRHRHGQDGDTRLDDRALQEAHARPRPQQDARRAALRGVPGVLSEQRGRVLRQLLRLLPAGGLPAPERHVHREGLVVIIVASVSCIYGLGAPVDYGATVLRLRKGGQYRRDAVLRHLVDLQYQRNDQALTRARFRVRGDTLEFQPASEEHLVRVEFFGDEVERITELDPLTGELYADRNEVNIYPASHYVTPADKMKEAIVDIEAEMEERVGQLEAEGRILEAARLRQRTTFDLEMMRELGFCTGIENYSRHLSQREPGSRPWTLLDYFPPDWLLVVDESHMTIPQVVGMYKNDRTRKEILVDFGFRLPSALDNRPLTFEEFEAHVNQTVYVSATPGPYEHEKSERIVEQLIRPTGIVDPPIVVRPTEGQIDDLLEEIRTRVERGERALVTTLTKKMAEDLADYLKELGIKVQYLHSEVDTLERVAILRDLRLGVYDVLVGINLLREGIDLPEVTLVAILDADKEGFLRSAWALLQMSGRAARNIGGEVVMYADRTTESMQVAIEETKRRRAAQGKYNEEHGIVPQTIIKGIHDINDRLRAVAESTVVYSSERRTADLAAADKAEVEKLVARMEAEMKAAAKQLEFERAA